MSVGFVYRIERDYDLMAMRLWGQDDQVELKRALDVVLTQKVLEPTF